MAWAAGKQFTMAVEDVEGVDYHLGGYLFNRSTGGRKEEELVDTEDALVELVVTSWVSIDSARRFRRTLSHFDRGLVGSTCHAT